MKHLKFILRVLVLNLVTTSIIARFGFVDTNIFSYYLAFFGFGLIAYPLIMWAFETKVADLHFQGKKIGTMKDEE